MRNNADRFPRPWEGRRPDKSVSQKRAASPGTGLFKGAWGLATNKRKGLFHETGIACRFLRTPVPPQGKAAIFQST